MPQVGPIDHKLPDRTHHSASISARRRRSAFFRWYSHQGDSLVIDPSIEDLVPVMDSRALFPPSRRKSADDPSNARTLIGVAKLLQLCTRGNSRGIKLESLIISGVRYTSRQAIARFLRAASAAEDGRADEAVTRRAKKATHPGPRRKPA